jgi:alpha-mannosidase
VVLETVKQAEDGNGTVLRLYESHNTKTKVTLAVPEGFKNAYSTNLLEQIEEELTVNDGKVTFTIKPYEIMTILLK